MIHTAFSEMDSNHTVEQPSIHFERDLNLRTKPRKDLPVHPPEHRDRYVQAACLKATIPPGFTIRAWQESDFPTVRQLSIDEGWTTARDRPEDTLIAWRRSWPTLVAIETEAVVGFVRAITDSEITIYVAELYVASTYRRKGIGHTLLDVCHHLFPNTRLDLLSTEKADSFYKSESFRPFQGYRKRYW